MSNHDHDDENLSHNQLTFSITQVLQCSILEHIAFHFYGTISKHNPLKCSFTFIEKKRRLIALVPVGNQEHSQVIQPNTELSFHLNILQRAAVKGDGGLEEI